MFLAKLKEGGRPFWNGKAQTYSINYLINYYKSGHHPIPTRENKNILAIFKINQ